MKIHSTNYKNTFISVAEDYNKEISKTPELKIEKPTIAALQYDLLIKNPYKLTSDEILFQIYAERKQLSNSQMEQEKEVYFSRGQACFQASPLCKTHGFGVHFDKDMKMALYPMEMPEYKNFKIDKNLKQEKAMRTSLVKKNEI